MTEVLFCVGGLTLVALLLWLEWTCDESKAHRQRRKVKP